MTKTNALRYLIGGAIGSAVGVMVGATIMERKSSKILKSLETEMRVLAVETLSKLEEQDEDDNVEEWFTNVATGYSFKTTRRQIQHTLNALNKSLLRGDQTRITMEDIDCAFGKRLLTAMLSDPEHNPYFWDKDHLITVAYLRLANRYNRENGCTMVTFGNCLRVFDDI